MRWRAMLQAIGDVHPMGAAQEPDDTTIHEDDELVYGLYVVADDGTLHLIVDWDGADYTLAAVGDASDRCDVTPTQLANGYRYAHESEIS